MADSATATSATAKTPRIEPDLIPGVIGVELARHTRSMRTVLKDFRRTKTISRSQMDELRNATEAVHRIAVYSQQLSRLAGGRLRQSHERLGLDSLMRRTLEDNDYRYYEAGLVVQHHMQPVEVILDPGLLVSLLEVAVDCAAQHGQVISIYLTIRNWPEHGLLTLQSRPHVGGTAAVPALEDSLEWVMLLQLAETIGVMVEREVLGDQVSITLEFPRTVRQLEGLTAIEVDAGDASAFGGDSKPLAGHRVLLVSGDTKLAAEIREICQNMRLRLDVTPTNPQAIRYCELDKPDIILVDERLHDEQFDMLREDLLRYEVNFPFVEVAAASNVVEMASWMGDRMSRISRDSLKSQLPSMLAMELAKVF